MAKPKNLRPYQESAKVDKLINKTLGSYPITEENAGEYITYIRTIETSLNLMKIYINKLSNITVFKDVER